jgi:hypothetical protein
MRDRIAFAIVLTGLILSANGQWLNYPDPRTPRTPGGKPNLTAPAPRAADGKLDLSGVWAAEGAPASVNSSFGGETFNADLQFISKYALNVFADLKPEEVPMRPAAAALVREHARTQGKDSPTSHCLPGGVPFSSLIAPFKAIQTQVEIVMLLEDNNPPRQIYIDGRPLPKDPEPSWMGYSSGKWDGETLVVETIGFQERSWIDAAGHPRSESMHIIERFHRRDFGHMDLEVTFDDPIYYTRAFTVKAGLRLLPDTDTLESVCAEGEKDRVHLDKN